MRGTYWNDDRKPRRFAVAASDIYVADVPYSPPVAKPCTRRARIRITAAHQPMISRVGMTATRNEQADMTVMLSIREAFRPRRSAYLPKNQDPTGRMRKVTAKIAKMYTIAFSSFSSKNCASKYVAKTV